MVILKFTLLDNGEGKKSDQKKKILGIVMKTEMECKPTKGILDDREEYKG